jgi:hypothetical protein
MDRFRAMALGGVEDFVDPQVAFRRRRRSKVRRFVGHADGERGPVRVRIDGNARDVQFTETADQADSDFAPIGDKDLAKHKRPIVAA